MSEVLGGTRTSLLLFWQSIIKQYNTINCHYLMIVWTSSFISKIIKKISFTYMKNDSYALKMCEYINLFHFLDMRMSIFMKTAFSQLQHSQGK